MAAKHLNIKRLVIPIFTLLIILGAAGCSKADTENEVVTPTPEVTPEVMENTPVDELYTADELRVVFSEIYESVKDKGDETSVYVAGVTKITKHSDYSRFPSDVLTQFKEFLAERQEPEVEPTTPPVQQPTQKPVQQPVQNPAEIIDSDSYVADGVTVDRGDGSGGGTLEPTGADILITLS